MARYQITGPDGRNYEITAPDDAKQEDVLAYMQKEIGNVSKPEVSQLESLGRGALQGATFGFSDEIYGAGKGAYDKLFGSGDFSGTYAKERDAVRAANANAKEANPGSYFGGEIVGGVALPFGAAKAGLTGVRAANASLSARSALAAKEGAAYGAAYGLGTGEGSLADQTVSTLGGAAGGAVLGGMLPGAIELAGAASRLPAQAVRVVSNPKRVAAEKMAEAFARDSGRETLGASNPLTNAAVSLGKDRARGEATMLADYGGENVKNLVRAAVNMPNAKAERFNQVLNRRQAVEGRRLEGSLRSTLASGEEFTASMDNLVSQRSQNAKPAFDAGYNAPVSRVADAELTGFFKDRGYAKRILDKANDSVMGMSGKTLQVLRPWEQIHRVKMEINREIGRLKRGQGDSVANWTARDLTELNQELGKIINKHNRDLGGALSKYSDESGLIEALQDGADDFFKLQPEELAKKIRSMPKDEADLYRVGAARAQVEKIRQGDVMRDRTKSLYGSDDIGLRMKAVFPDGASRAEFMRTVNAARRMAATRRAAQGNSTTAKQLTNAVEAGKAAKTVADVAGAATGRPGAIASLLERGTNFASGITPRVASELLQLSMIKDAGQSSGATTRAIQEAFARGQARKALQGRLTSALLPAPGVLSAEFSNPKR